MTFIGNVIWFVVAGFWSFLSWSLVGLLLCLSIIGIPFGIQCFKIASFGLFPFGKEVIPSNQLSSLFFNILWIVFFGWELFLVHLVTAIALCLTIIGIPFALQSLKLAMLCLFPFGVSVIKS